MKSNPIRSDAQRIEVYNDGLLVILFDEANYSRIENSGADLEGGFSEDPAQIDPALKKLARQSIYLAYELEQDDCVCVDIMVGKPLSNKELSVARWHKPQRGCLVLPSGRLQVHTANTLSLQDELDDKPGIVEVPPGDYAVTMYRIDWTEMRNDGLVSDERDSEEKLWDGPQDLIVLTPIVPPKKLHANKPFLNFPKKAQNWIGNYQITEDTFEGLVTFPSSWENFLVNVDEAAGDKLNLVPCNSLRIEVADFDFRVVYFGEAILADLARLHWAKPIAAGQAEFGVAFRLRDIDVGRNCLNVVRVVSTRAFETRGRWLPAKVTKLNDSYEIPKSSLGLGQDSIDNLDPSDIDLLFE